MAVDHRMLAAAEPSLTEGHAGRLPEIGLCGCVIHAASEGECVRYVLDEIDAGRGGWVVTPNLDHLRRFLKDREFRQMYSEADLRVADGFMLLLASRLQRTPLPERVAGSDLIWSLSKAAGERGRSIFLLGGNEGTDVAAAEVLAEQCPGLRIAGTACPAPGFDRIPLEMARLSKQIRESRADIVYVALGSPKQERIIRGLRHQLPGAWWLGVGISFSFVCGDVQRAPAWMQRAGLEWLHRLAQEPRRLARRYLLQGMPFAAWLLLRTTIRGFLPKGREAGPFGRRRLRALIVDDDQHAVDMMEVVLSSRFPQLEIEKRTEPNVQGDFDFYFLDDDFDGERLAARLATEIRERQPNAKVFACSAVLGVDTLKGLINAGCHGVCDKTDPKSWMPMLEATDRRFADLARERRRQKKYFGGVRQSADSIQTLLTNWNEQDVDEEPPAERARTGS
jgi:N-acetylglucosaminyldiphosphoundecaprenol N-acetyl-beta-D-mannosaminyltransferase